MNYVWFLIAFFAGGFFGAFAMAICAVNRDYPILNPDNVAAWLMKMLPAEREKITEHLVRRVYNGERHIHRDPAKRKQVGDKFTDYPKEVSNG